MISGFAHSQAPTGGSRVLLFSSVVNSCVVAISFFLDDGSALKVWLQALAFAVSR
jgi:hypothetical protein